MKRKFWQRKKYNNPFLRESNQPPGRKLNKRGGKVWLIIGIFLILLLVVYIVLYSPIFRIDKIVISGVANTKVVNKLQIIARRETAGYRLLILPRNNIFCLKVSELEKRINDEVNLDYLLVEKKLLNTLQIEAEEKLPALLWKNGDEFFYVDKSGMVMGAIDWDKVKYDLPIVSRGTTTVVTVGEKIIDSRDRKFITDVLVKFGQRFFNLKVQEIEVRAAKSNEIYFYTNEGWYFILPVGEEIDSRLNNLDRLLKQKLGNRERLEYVDLRLVDRLFYK